MVERAASSIPGLSVIVVSATLEKRTFRIGWLFLANETVSWAHVCSAAETTITAEQPMYQQLSAAMEVREAMPTG